MLVHTWKLFTNMKKDPHLTSGVLSGFIPYLDNKLALCSLYNNKNTGKNPKINTFQSLTLGITLIKSGDSFSAQFNHWC